MQLKILILGAGYAGLTTALQLQRELKYNEAEITLVNRHDYHYFTTHLHQTAAGTVNAKNIKIELDEILDMDIINFLKAEVKSIDLEGQKVILKQGPELTYDILIIALGSEVETFGIKGLKEYAFSIRSINTVQLIREHIDYMFAKYKSENENPQYLTFVVGGAGFTGIEFVGELADRVPSLCKEFGIDEDKVRIINVEASSTPLPGFDISLIEYAIDVLKSKGVEFIINTPIQEVNSEGLILNDGTVIKSKTVVWTGGVRGNRIIEQTGIENIRGRVKVDDYLRLPGSDNVFVIGDNSIMFDNNGKPYPPTAQLATNQGIYLSKQLISYIRTGNFGKEKFNFKSKGTVASLGKGIAIGKIGEYKIAGYKAALLKNITDIRYLYSIGGLALILKKRKLF